MNSADQSVIETYALGGMVAFQTPVFGRLSASYHSTALRICSIAPRVDQFCSVFGVKKRGLTEQMSGMVGALGWERA